MGYKKETNQISQKESQQLKHPKKLSRDKKTKLTTLVLVIGVICSVFLQQLICRNWQQLAPIVFRFGPSDKGYGKFSVLKESMLKIAVFQFLIALVIMNIRIFGQKIKPVAEKDPLSIALLNRILSNNIQQSFVFFGLYLYLLLSHQPDLEPKYIFGLPLLFLLGRVFYLVTYIITTVVRISSIKSIGFMFSVAVNLFMILELILGQTQFLGKFLFG